MKFPVSFMRAAVCGAVPLLYIVCRVCTQILNAGLHLSITYPAAADIPQPDLESRTLSLSKGVTHIPDRLAYKQSYPIKGHSQEGPLFSQLVGQFGVTDVIGYSI